MKLWLLRPLEHLQAGHNVDNNPWSPWYDKTFGFVVRAKTEQEARQLAQANGSDEIKGFDHNQKFVNWQPWLDPAYSTCVELTAEGEAGVIIEDHARA